MSDYSWNRTGDVDEFARTLEETLECLTPQPGTLELPFELEREVERSRRSRARELLLGVSIVAILAVIFIVAFAR